MYKKIIVSTLFVSVIAACGYKGALYLPKPKPTLQPVASKTAESVIKAESGVLLESAIRIESTLHSESAPRKSILPTLIAESTPAGVSNSVSSH